MPQHLLDGGDALGHRCRPRDAQRPHAMFDGRQPQPAQLRPFGDEGTDGLAVGQNLVQPGPPPKTRHPAGHTAHRPPDLRRLRHIFEGLDESGPLLVRHRIIGLPAGRAQRARQPLRHHPDQRGLQQVGRHTQIQQPRDGTGRIVGVQRGDHQVPGQRRLHRHLRRFQIADLAHHDDVRILPHQRADAIGKAQIDGRLHLHLVEAVFHHLDRILDGGHIHLLRGQCPQRGVERRRLARARRPRHQHDAVGPRSHLPPAGQILPLQPQLVEVALQHVRIEHPHHQLLAKGRGQRGQAQLDLVAIGRPRLDPPVLRPAPLHHIHPPQQLDAAGHGRHHPRRHLIDIVQQPVDTEAHHAQIPPRLQVNVAGPLLERVLPQPVHQRDDVLVVGIDLPAAPAQLDQLLETVLCRRLPRALRTANGAGQIEEFHQIALQVHRTGQYRHHPAAQRVRQFRGPFSGHEWLGRGNRHRLRRYLQWQDAEAVGIGLAHHLRNPREIHLQRIDAHVAPADVLCQPAAQPVQIQRLVRRPQRLEPARRNHFQRMTATGRQGGVAGQRATGVLVDEALVGQQGEQAVDGQGAVGVAG